MEIKGLENNYYLSGNDIWVSVVGFSQPVSILEVKVKNLTSNLEIPPFRMSPGPDNTVSFNICQIIRALQPEPNHINLNTLQSYEIIFTAIFTNADSQSETLTKYFIRGGRQKNGNDEWYLNSVAELVVGTWINWEGIGINIFPMRIMNDIIVGFVPLTSYKRIIPNCDFKIIKFINSLGGIQYYVFEKYEEKTKTKAGKIISKISNRLRKDNFRNVGIEVEKAIKLFTKTPFEIQDVITDLISSHEVFLYNPLGSDDNAKWVRLILENNDSVKNNYDSVFHNEIEFSFSNYINRSL